MKAEPLILAVDLGGTKVALGIVSAAGTILHRLQEPTCQSGPQDGIAQIINLARRILEEGGLTPAQLTCLGVGLPAVLETGTDRVIWAPRLPGWSDVPLRSALQDALGLPAYIEYDGHTAVLGEWWLGSGRGYQSVVEVIVGTGLGGGMILDGRLYRGFNRLAGTAGWFALTTDFDHPDSLARSFGFWDSLASGSGLVRYALSLAPQYPASRLWDGQQLTAVEIFSAAHQGDPLSHRVLDQLAGWLGLGIANIVSLVNPQVIILGGGIGSQCADLIPRIRQVMGQWAQPVSAQSVEIKTSSLGADGGLLGAAYSALLRWQIDSEKPGSL